MDIFGKQYAVNDLRKRIGAMDQLAGVRLVQLTQGRAHPARAAVFHNGSGLDFTVALDRAMDIAHASFAGRPMGWRAVAGDVAPQYYEPLAAGWLRGYAGGLLTTCGLTYVGAPPADPVSPTGDTGLHGRISYTPAEDVQVSQQWEGEDYVLRVTGTMRQAVLFGENLTLTRTVSTRLGAKWLRIDDCVTNEGFEPAPLMLLYHCNVGWPAVDAGSRVIAPSRAVAPRDDTARDGGENWNRMDAPTPGYAEKVYFHDMAPADDGTVTAAIVNDGFDAGTGFGVYVQYSRDTLPRFTQWKQMGAQDYVCGLEPCNCGVEGRHVDAERGLLQQLEPGEQRRFQVTFGALTTAEEVAGIEAHCAGIETRHAAHYTDFVKP